MNEAIQDRFGRFGAHVPSLIIPSPNVDLYRWAVIACDQHTSEPDYWEEVAAIVGDAPSALGLIFPELYLKEPDASARIDKIHATMQSYLSTGVLRQMDPGLMLTVRSTPHVSERKGLILAVDLDHYDFNPGSGSIVRATEGTILERLPARVRVRKGAPIEIPHVQVLIDDPHDVVFGSLSEAHLPQIYSTQLMLGGGSVAGYHLSGAALDTVALALESLLAGAKGSNPFLFAVGDGNHALAAAKRVWEEMKPSLASAHPARYALVEVVNLYDPGTRIEPIHRLIRAADPNHWVETFVGRLGSSIPCPVSELRAELRHRKGTVGYIAGERSGLITLTDNRELPVTVVQAYLNREAEGITDYIHGWETSVQLGGRADQVAILMPEFDPALLFPTISERGVLPRKAFSLGDAAEKRYYLEGRMIDG